MVNLHNLPKITSKKKKRIGRGYGSGVGGHTTIRGAKGTKARGKVPLAFDGTKTKKSWLKRLPLWRGKGKKRSLRRQAVVNVQVLETYFKDGDKVNLKSLIKKGLIKERRGKRVEVKILGQGELTRKLEVSLPCSKRALEKIKIAGGRVKDEQMVGKS